MKLITKSYLFIMWLLILFMGLFWSDVVLAFHL